MLNLQELRWVTTCFWLHMFPRDLCEPVRSLHTWQSLCIYSQFFLGCGDILIDQVSFALDAWWLMAWRWCISHVRGAGSGGKALLSLSFEGLAVVFHFVHCVSQLRSRSPSRCIIVTLQRPFTSVSKVASWREKLHLRCLGLIEPRGRPADCRRSHRAASSEASSPGSICPWLFGFGASHDSPP